MKPKVLYSKRSTDIEPGRTETAEENLSKEEAKKRLIQYLKNYTQNITYTHSGKRAC